MTDGGLWGNEVLADTECCGVSTVARLSRDVFGQPHVRDVILLEGINDIGCSATAFALCTGSTPDISAAKVIAGYRRIIAAAHAHGIRIFGATMTSFKNAEEYAPGYWTPLHDGGDHLHPNDAGYQPMADALNLGSCCGDEVLLRR